MSHIRATFRAVALCALTCAFCALWLASAVFVIAFDEAELALRRFIFRHWARATAALLGVRINAQGRPPRGAFFLVSNHLSYLDVVVFAALTDCVFIAKSEVARWPVIGLLSRRMNTIFIDREKRRDAARANALIERILAQGRGVVLFAEGTSTRGAVVLPFKSALLEQAARASFPVSYAALSYGVREGQSPAHMSVCWWGEMTFLKHLFELFHLSEIRAIVRFGSEGIQEGDRKMLATRLHHAVSSEFIPVVGLGGGCGAQTR
jgi:1-acyl-sn-glycerol-3-phosphate acyltransferase